MGRDPPRVHIRSVGDHLKQPGSTLPQAGRAAAGEVGQQILGAEHNQLRWPEDGTFQTG